MRLFSFFGVVRALSVLVVIGVSTPLACGGKALGGGGNGGGSGGTGGSGGSGGGSGGSAGSGGSGGTGGVGGSGGIGGSGGTGGLGGSGGSGGGTTGTCVDIVASSFDQSCNSPSDCMAIASGPVCDGQCDCPTNAINVSGAAAYKMEIAGVTPADCPCIGAPTLCLAGRCTIGGGGGGGSPGDAGPPPTQVNCFYAEGSVNVCYTYTGLDPSQTMAIESACSAMSGGKLVSACPAGEVGCCEDIAMSGSSIVYGYCTYGVPKSAIPGLMSSCTAVKGVWTM